MANQRFFVGAAAGFGLALLVASLYSPFSSNVNLVLAGVIGLLVGAWALRAYNTETDRLGVEWQFDDAAVKVDENKLGNMKKEGLDRFRYQLVPGETEIRRATRYSRNRLCFIPVLLAMSFYMFSIAVQVGSAPAPALDKAISVVDELKIPFVDSMSEFELPKEETKKRKKAANQRPRGNNQVREYPFGLLTGLLSALLALGALWLRIDWLSSAALITNVYNVDARIPPAYMPLMKVKYDRTPLAKVEDVDPEDTFWSRWIGMRSWGSVVARVIWDNKETKELRLNGIPGHEAYAADLLLAAQDAGGATSIKQDFRQGVQRLHNS